MLKSLDRIKELTSTTGTGTLTLTGAESGFQAFSVLGNGTKCYYTITDVNTTDFEVGEGTYNSNTLTRDTIFESSNSGNAISLSATGSTVFVTYPAEKSSYRDIGVNRDYTASGSITAGKPLILNADNTVSQVAETTSTIPAGLGTNSSIAISSSVYDQQVSMGATNQFISLYTFANDTKCYLTPNTISSDLKTITSGVETNFDTGNERNTGIIYEPNQGKYVAFYLDGLGGSNYYPCARVLEFVGTGATATISFGTPTILDSNASQGGFNNNKLTYDTNAQKFILSFVRNNSSGWTMSVSLSGSTITAGTPIAVPMYGTYVGGANITCSYSSTADKTVYLYTDNNTEDLYTTVGTVSGSSFTFGSTAVVSNLPTGNFNGADACVGVDNNGVVVLSYLAQDITPAYTLFSQAGTLSGTTITWGSPSQVSNVTCLNNARNECSIESIASGKMIITRATRSDSPSNADDGIFVIVTSSGTTVTNGSVQTFSTSATRYPSVSTNYSKTQAVINYGDASSMDVNNIIYLESQQTGSAVSNLLSDNYFGVASSTASTTEPVGVNRAGSFNNDQSGMTAGKDMYVTDAGLIKERVTTSTTPDTNPTVTTPVAETGSSVANEGISISYEATSGYYLRSRRDLNTNYPVAESGTYSSSTKEITWSTAVVLKSESLRGNHVYNTTGGGYGHIAFTTRQSTYENPTVKLVTVSGGTLTLKGEEIVTQLVSSANIIYPTGISYDTSQNTIIAVFANLYGTTSWIKAYPMVENGYATGYTYSSSNIATINDDSSSGIRVSASNGSCLRFDSDTNRTIVIYSDFDSPYYVHAKVISASGVTLTVGSQQDSTLPNRGELANCYDSQNDKFIIVTNADQSGNDVKYIIATVTGGGTNTISFTSPAFLFSDTSTVSESFGLEYDADVNQSYFVYLKSYSTTGLLMFSSNGSTITTNSDTTIYSTSYPKPFGNYSMVYVANKGVSASIGYDNTSMVNFNITLGSTTSTVVNGSQFVGTARSGTDLELSEPPTELVAMANGSITKGKPVIVRTDGDFQQITQTTTSFSQGTAGDITEAYRYGCMTYDLDEDKYLYFYKGWTGSESGKLCYRLGTPSGSGTSATITWGSQTELISGVYIEDTDQSISACYDSTNKKTVIVYENANYAQLRSSVITISGTTVTASSEVTISTDNIAQTGIVYASNYSKVVAVWYYSSTYYASIGTIDSSGVISWTSPTNSSAGTISAGFSNTYDPSQNAVVISYQDAGNSNYGTSVVGELNSAGSSISFGSEVVFYSNYARVYAHNLTTDTENNKIINCYRDNTNSGVGKCQVGTVTGNNISWGSAVQFGSVSVGNPAVAYNSSANIKKSMVVFQQQTGSYYFGVADITVLGTTPTITSTTDLTSIGSSSYPADAIQILAITDNNQFAIATQNNNREGDYIVVTPEQVSTNLTSSNFIGFAENTVADNEDVKVKVISQTDENQTGLTTASQYYVQTDGTLSTTAGTPSVLGGTALSSTKILIKS